MWPLRSPGRAEEFDADHHDSKGFHGSSPARTNSDDLACLVPAWLAGGPEPLHVAVRTSWVGGSAEGAHRVVEWNVSVPSVDGVPLSGEREPHEGLGFRVRSGHNSEH
jgi:hypothetical protein